MIQIGDVVRVKSPLKSCEHLAIDSEGLMTDYAGMEYVVTEIFNGREAHLALPDTSYNWYWCIEHMLEEVTGSSRLTLSDIGKRFIVRRPETECCGGCNSLEGETVTLLEILNVDVRVTTVTYPYRNTSIHPDYLTVITDEKGMTITSSEAMTDMLGYGTSTSYADTDEEVEIIEVQDPYPLAPLLNYDYMYKARSIWSRTTDEDKLYYEEKTGLQILSRRMKRILSPELRTQYRAGYINKQLELTPKGVRALLDVLSVKHKEDLTNEALEEIKEQERNN